MRALLLLLPLLALAGCRFERRPDVGGQGTMSGGSGGAVTVPSMGEAQDSVRAVVEAFHEALRVGDGSRIGALSVPSVLLLDQEEGIRWSRGAPEGAPLPGALSGQQEGLGWTRVSSDYDLMEGVALVVDHYRATVSGESIPWTAVESHVLVRTADGWRLRLLHRSRGLGRSGPR